ncbi:MAG: serine hydrolase [Cyanobacteria bacterium P01_H01_bin.121]
MAFFQKDPNLTEVGDRLLEATWQQFPTLARNQIALTWLVYTPPAPIRTGAALTPEAFWQYPIQGYSYRGVEQIYPASVVKLFYLLAVYEWFAKGMLQTSAELERAVRDMIVDSSNDATGLVLDMLTGTTSGPELPAGPFETWQQQRNLINRYVQSLGWPELESINVNQKTWCDGPYGRERAFLGSTMENRNALSTEATARLLHSIIGGVAVSPAASESMLALMARSLDPATLAADPENQVTGFLGGGLPLDAKLWSKAGLTSKVRHDAAFIELPNTYPYLLVVFTTGPAQSESEAILPFISAQLATFMAEAYSI